MVGPGRGRMDELGDGTPCPSRGGRREHAADLAGIPDGVDAHAEPGVAGGRRRAGLDGDGRRRHDLRRPPGRRGHRRRQHRQHAVLRRGRLRPGVAAGPGHPGLAGVRGRPSRRVPSMAGPGGVSLPDPVADGDGPVAGEHPLAGAAGAASDGPGGGRPVPAVADLEHLAVAALRGVPALLAGHGGGQAGDVRPDQRQRHQRAGRLDPDLRRTGGRRPWGWSARGGPP